MESLHVSPERALQIIQSLLRIRTALPAGDEMDCAKYILSLFPKNKIKFHMLDHGHNRASLKISLSGKSSFNLALVGHMDTVGLGNPQVWRHSPFGADVEGDEVFGLGAMNMKGGLTSILMAALTLIESGMELPVNLHLCFSADEEINGIGAGALLRSGLMDDMNEIIIAEPTTMKVGLAEKGALWLRLTVHGQSCHSALPDQGVSALEGFLEIARRIRQLFADERAHRLLGHSTCEITELSAGTAPNALPPVAVGTLDIRILPKTNYDALMQEVKEITCGMEQEEPRLSISIDSFNLQPPVGMNGKADMVKRIRQIFLRRGLPYEEIGIHTFTDASRLIPVLGVPFVIMGPGEHQRGYQADESVSLTSICQMANVYIDYIQSLAEVH